MNNQIGKINPMFNEKLLYLYNNLVGNKTDLERFSTAGMSEVRLLSPGIVIKRDKDTLFIGQKFVEREFERMTELWESGFRRMPQPLDLFYDESDDPVLAMSEITHGIPLEEIAQFYKEGKISSEIMEHILKKDHEVLSHLWDMGFIHADAHLKNILVGMNSSQEWYIHVIDYGMSFWAGKDDRVFPCSNSIDCIDQDYELHLECLLEYGLDKIFESFE
jgi:RIO-like serine/threonine protein kinase